MQTKKEGEYVGTQPQSSCRSILMHAHFHTHQQITGQFFDSISRKVSFTTLVQHLAEHIKSGVNFTSINNPLKQQRSYKQARNSNEAGNRLKA